MLFPRVRGAQACLFWRVLATGSVILCWGRCRAGAESRVRLCICSGISQFRIQQPMSFQAPAEVWPCDGFPSRATSCSAPPMSLSRWRCILGDSAQCRGLRDGGGIARASPSSLCPSAGAALPMGHRRVECLAEPAR